MIVFHIYAFDRYFIQVTLVTKKLHLSYKYTFFLSVCVLSDKKCVFYIQCNTLWWTKLKKCMKRL